MTPTGYFLDHLWLVPLFPLATAALMLFFGRRLPKVGVSMLCVGSVGLSFIYAVGAVLQLLATEPEHRVAQQILFEWLTPGPMQMTGGQRSEEHTSELQSQSNIVCRLLLEKKK